MTELISSVMVISEQKSSERSDNVKARTEIIRIEMAKKCMTSIDVYKKANLSKTTFNSILSGQSVRPSSIGKIAKALNVDVTEILED